MSGFRPWSASEMPTETEDNRSLPRVNQDRSASVGIGLHAYRPLRSANRQIPYRGCRCVQTDAEKSTPWGLIAHKRSHARADDAPGFGRVPAHEPRRPPALEARNPVYPFANVSGMGLGRARPSWARGKQRGNSSGNRVAERPHRFLQRSQRGARTENSFPCDLTSPRPIRSEPCLTLFAETRVPIAMPLVLEPRSKADGTALNTKPVFSFSRVHMSFSCVGVVQHACRATWSRSKGDLDSRAVHAVNIFSTAVNISPRRDRRAGEHRGPRNILARLRALQKDRVGSTPGPGKRNPGGFWRVLRARTSRKNKITRSAS